MYLLRLIYVILFPLLWYGKEINQPYSVNLPYELRIAMPPTDKGKRGYSDIYVAKIRKELTLVN